MRLTELQRHEIDEALNKAAGVLAIIKRKILKGEDLKLMKLLEEAVQDIEIFRGLVK